MQEKSNYTGVMVDLETMSTHDNAAIVSIGAVKFWLNVTQDVFTPDQLFHVQVDLASSQEAGLDIDADTVMFWLEQSKAAQESIMRGIDLKQALEAFSRWFPKDAFIFAHGAMFDLTILRSAYKAVNLPHPTGFRKEMCYRTLKAMTDVPPVKVEGLTQHNALHDSMVQTRHLMAILEKTPWHGK